MKDPRSVPRQVADESEIARRSRHPHGKLVAGRLLNRGKALTICTNVGGEAEARTAHGCNSRPFKSRSSRANIQLMNEQVKKLAEEAAKLSPDERAELVEGILMTFDPPKPDIDALWLAEVKDRALAYERGEMPAADMEEVLEKHRQRIASK